MQKYEFISEILLSAANIISNMGRLVAQLNKQFLNDYLSDDDLAGGEGLGGRGEGEKVDAWGEAVGGNGEVCGGRGDLL